MFQVEAPVGLFAPFGTLRKIAIVAGLVLVLVVVTFLLLTTHFAVIVGFTFTTRRTLPKHPLLVVNTATYK